LIQFTTARYLRQKQLSPHISHPKTKLTGRKDNIAALKRITPKLKVKVNTWVGEINHFYGRHPRWADFLSEEWSNRQKAEYAVSRLEEKSGRESAPNSVRLVNCSQRAFRKFLLMQAEEVLLNKLAAWWTKS